MRSGGAIAALLLMAAAAAGAESLELSGDLKLQGRWYPQSPAFPEQRSSAVGLAVEPTLYWEPAPATGFTLTPFYRYDSADSRRTQADLREAYMLTYGDWGENSWELRWGSTAFSRLRLRAENVTVAAREILTNAAAHHAVVGTKTESVTTRVADVGRDLRRARHVSDEVTGTLLQRAGMWLSNVVREARLHAKATLFD